MTYKNLKSFLSSAGSADEYRSFDLIPPCVKSKIIFAVGAGATNTSAYLSSIMNERQISHSRAICSRYIEAKNRFIERGSPISIEKLLSLANDLKKSCGQLSPEELYFLLALALLDGKSEYLILELSYDLYERIRFKLSFAPFAVILCEYQDNISVPDGTSYLVALSKLDDFNYISRKTTDKGAILCLVSPNKIDILSSNPLKTRFFYNSEQYLIRTVDQSNIARASLAIESASAIFAVPRLCICRGMENAEPELDATLISVSPTVLFKLGDDDITLPKGKNYTIITESTFSEESEISNNSIFCGTKEFLCCVKEKIASKRTKKQKFR